MADYPDEVRHAARGAYLHLRDAAMDDETFKALTAEAPKRPRGRPRKNPLDLGKRPNVTLRVRQVIYDQVKAAAKANGRSMSEEMEARIEAALAIEDIRDILREELGPRRLAYPDLRATKDQGWVTPKW